jgi:hypothetical protein
MIHRDVLSSNRTGLSTRWRPTRRVATILMAASVAGVTLAPHRVAAQQQRQGEVHANYSRQTQSKSNAWGAGTQLQLVWGAKHAPVVLGTSLGGDYLKQENGGPTSWNTSADAVVEPGGNGAVTPYAGASAGANWSTGTGAQWTGARLGLETLGGVQFRIGAASAKLEERFGYVRGQEHNLGTRFGLQFKL